MTLAMTIWLSFECLSLLLQADSGSSSGPKEEGGRSGHSRKQPATLSAFQLLMFPWPPQVSRPNRDSGGTWEGIPKDLHTGRPDYTIDTSSELLTDRDYWKLVIGEPITGQ